MTKPDKVNLETVLAYFRHDPIELRYVCGVLGYRTRGVQRGNLYLLKTIARRIYNLWGIRFGENHLGDIIVGLSSTLQEEIGDCLILFGPEEQVARGVSHLRRMWIWYHVREGRMHEHDTREEALNDIWEEFGMIPGEPLYDVENTKGRGWENDPIDDEEARRMSRMADEEFDW